MFGAKPLMKENVLGKPPSSFSLKKKIFGAAPSGKSAKPFGSPSSPFKGQSLNPFGKEPKTKQPKNLLSRLTGK